TGYDVVVPLAKLEKHYIPSVDRIVDGVRQAMEAS
ncbi:MAG: alpha-ketoacid dehydrogenase subunit beta, partial [Alphaproteobacteria bacterium]|nr:alpha-ketoacid dehydrogenase subunit beta [Alphaproteobacteria bacterium]